MPKRKLRLGIRFTGLRLTVFLALAALTIVAFQSFGDPAHALNNARSRTIVINEVYGGGGNASATFTNDYVELLNLSPSSVDVSAWSIQYQTNAGTTWTVINLCTSASPGTCVIPAGRFYLVVLASGGANGGALPASNAPASATNLSGVQGKIALVNSQTALPSNTGSNCTGLPITGPTSVIDEVGYGASSNACFEGSGPAPTNTNSATSTSRATNNDTEQNAADFVATSPPTPQNLASAPIVPTAADGAVSGRIVADDGAPIAGAVVRMTGEQTRKTITDANGYYRFDAVETAGFYTVSPSSRNFSFSPGERSFSQLGSNTEAIFTGSRIGNGNLLDTPEYFVRQHYLDFLGREPDELGFNFWSDQILGCGGDANCNERRTINVSAAYFLSAEFQQTGALLDRLYKASFGRGPQYAEFVPDRAALARNVVVGQRGWETEMTANRESFLRSWVERDAFRAAYDNLGNDGYVDTLISNTGVSFSSGERDSFVAALNSGSLSRAGVLAEIAGNASFARARFNEAFVTAEYFGYLRRDPDSRGLNFWLNKLNEFDGNFERAEMVKAFLVSGEYRARFGQ